MARLPRLQAPGLAHLVWLPALSGITLFADVTEVEDFKAALREASATEGVSLHAYTLMPHEVRLLATPSAADALARWVQAIGRRFVRAYNARHQRHGPLWSGRFRCACVEPGGPTLEALRWAERPLHESSLLQRTGRRAPEGWLTDPPAYWTLGNTPFDREQAYARILEDALPAARSAAVESCLRGGWPYGSPAFADSLAAHGPRPVRPRPRGRPAGLRSGGNRLSR